MIAISSLIFPLISHSCPLSITNNNPFSNFLSVFLSSAPFSAFPSSRYLDISFKLQLPNNYQTNLQAPARKKLHNQLRALDQRRGLAIRIRALAGPDMAHGVDFDVRQDAQVGAAAVFVGVHLVVLGVGCVVGEAEAEAFGPVGERMVLVFLLRVGRGE